MKFSIEVLDSDKTIINNILKGIAEDFNNAISGKIEYIRNKIASQIVPFLKSTSTYESLVNGELAGHFGLPINDRYNRVNAILEMVGKNLEVEYNPVKVNSGKFVGGTNIGVLIKDFVDILNMSEAVVQTEKGQALPWLDWLLLKGNALIVSEHEVKFIPGKGRSTMALMINNNAGVWRVPPEYSGTVRSNWLINAFTTRSEEYLSIIQKVIEEVV